MADQPATPDSTQQVQQVIKDVNQSQSVIPIEFKTDTGQVFKGQNWEDIAQQMKKSVESGTTTIRDLNQRLSEQQTQPQPQPVPGPQDLGNVQKAEYWKRWQEDPIDAQRYADSVRLGIPIEQVDQAIRNTMQQAVMSQQQNAGADFQARCPDFPKTQEATQALLGAMKQRYMAMPPPQSAQELADRLEVTYGALVRSGQIQPANNPLPVDSGMGGPIPRLGPSTTQSQGFDVTQQAYSMPMDKLKATIEEAQRRGIK